MQPEQPTKPSFFDDDDLNVGFEFQMPNRSAQKDLNLPCRIKDTLIRQLPNSSTIDEGYYALHNKTLARYKSSSSKILTNVLDLSFSRVKLLVPTDTNPHYGFSLTKNGITHEFYHPGKPIIEDWFECLKDVCVLTTFHEEYKAHKMIGKGSFAKVYLVESSTTGKKYAVKAFTKESLIHANKNNAKPSMLNEVDIMRSLDHENVIKLYEVYETEKSIYLVLELIQGKSLQEILKRPTFKEEYSDVKVTNMIRSILDALAYLASKGIMHRDLKPDNILLDKEGKIKLADFGLATFIDIPEYIFKKCGTPGYIAPEVFKYDHNNPLTDYDHRCDVFSAGCIFFYMLFRTPFFDGSNASEILRLNRKFTYEFNAVFTIQKELMSPSSKMSKDGLKLLLKLLEFDPKNRISAQESLCHPFFIPVPMGMQKTFGTNDLITDPFAMYNQNDSPTWLKGSNPNSPKLGENFSLPKQNSFKNFASMQGNKDRFMEKDSLYLDMGKMELNGRTDTINTGLSNNNSLLLQKKNSNASIGSNSSASGFGKLSPDKKSKSFKGPTGGPHNNHDFLKAAIFRNMQRNNSEVPFQASEATGDQSQSAGLPGGISNFSTYRHQRSESQDSGQTQEGLSEGQSEGPSEEGGKEISPIKGSPTQKRKFHPFAQNAEKMTQ